MTDGHELNPEALGDHIDRLYRAAWSMCGDRHEAEDLVQETLALVLRRRRWVQSDDDIGYLLRALRNTFIGSRRTAARRPIQAPMPNDLAVADDRAFVSPEAHVETAELYAAVAQLPPDFRDAVMAVDVIGLSYREAAKALHVREATLTTRVHRGRTRLADALRIT